MNGFVAGIAGTGLHDSGISNLGSSKRTVRLSANSNSFDVSIVWGRWGTGMVGHGFAGSRVWWGTGLLGHGFAGSRVCWGTGLVGYRMFNLPCF